VQFFYWNKNFEIGIPSLDAQHRRLVDMINELAGAISDGAKLPEIHELFGALMEYAAVHFRDEELLLEQSPLSADDKDRHRRAHRGFVDKVKDVTQHHDLLKTEVAESVLEFLVTWLISHILGSDRKIADAMRQSAAEPSREAGLLEVSPVEKALLNALTETERRFRLISDNTPALMWVADAKGERGFMNRAWSDFLDWDSIEAGDQWKACIHAEDIAAYLGLLDSLSKQPRAADAEYRLKNKAGRYRWYLEKILPRIGDNGEFVGLIASATDITPLKEAEILMSHANEELEKEVARRTAQLEKLMLTDPLTGVGNRRYLNGRIEAETERARRYQRALTAVFLDLDHFKQINDSYGHATGDVVLVRAATTLKNCLRECDVLARVGGEEFIVLLPDTPLEQAVAAAERWRVDIAALRMTEDGISVTASAGVAQLAPNENGEALLKRCDEALYRAKSEGRNCVRVGVALVPAD